MPIVVSISKGQERDIDLLLSGIKNGSSRAMFTAVQRTSKTAKTNLGRLVRSELNLKKKDADKTVFIRRPPTVDQPIAGIRISGRLISLNRFGARQLKRQGVVATTFKSKGRQRYAASFINNTRLHGSPFSRQQQKDNRQSGPISGRLPIFKLMGPSAADAVTARQSEFESTVAELGPVLEKNLLSQVDRLLARKRK